MKRFNCTIFDKSGVNGKAMEACKMGDYVKHSDALENITELEKENKELQEYLKELE